MSVLIKVPGFAPKRIYLENVADQSQRTTSSPASTPTQPKKGFLGVKWGFDGEVKR